MPSKGRGGEAERQKERFENWLRFTKDARLMKILRSGTADDFHELSIGRACKAFGLEQGNKQDRELLLGVLADILFDKWDSPPNLLSGPPRRKRGRPHEWANKEGPLLKAIEDLYSQADLLPTSRRIAEKVLKSPIAKDLKLPSLERLIEKITEMRKDSALSIPEQMPRNFHISE